jgi:BirA family transcriptional regulator, biotin operon repressor / biotin---[acetyl-CoA-carboxylase] ligase
MFTGMPGDRARSGVADTPGTRARAALAGGRFADVRWVAATGSTNADVMTLARDGAPEGVVVVADHQSAGRGRRSRSWVAPASGSLLLSVLLRPPAAVAGAVTMATAVALAEAVERVAGVAPGLKWPNDLVLPGRGATADTAPDAKPAADTAAANAADHAAPDAAPDTAPAAAPDAGCGDRKLAGILAEADWPAGSTVSGGWRQPAAHERAVVVVGVGLNVSWPEPAAGDAGAEELVAVADTAIALNWVGADVDRVDLLVAFLRRLDERYGELVGTGSAAVIAEWRRRSATLGRRVRVDLGGDDVDGMAIDVTADGHLVVETLDGDRRTIAVGDVVHLWPA